MAKPANSERIYSDKLPMALKPVGCSYTGAEWKHTAFSCKRLGHSGRERHKR